MPTSNPPTDSIPLLIASHQHSAMDSRDVLSPTKRRPMTSEKAAAARAPPMGGVHSYVTDHSSRPGNELDHKTVNPLSISAPVRRGGVRDRSFFSSDDNSLSKQVVATHAPDMEDVNVGPILSIIEDILALARPSTTADVVTFRAQTQPRVEELDDRVFRTSDHDDRQYHNNEHDSEIVEVLAYPINKISCEIICKHASGGESHSQAMELLKSLSSYSWDAKAVITFAAFAINYGEFWLVEQFHTKNALAQSIATLKDVPDLMARASELKPMFDAVLNVLTAVLKVTHCIIQFKELPPMYVGRDSPEVTAATAHISTAVYWIIRSLLVCTFTLLNLAGSGDEYITSTTESWEISNLAHKLSVIMEHLQRQLQICYALADRKKEEDAYARFKRIIESSHVDNMIVLRAIIHAREDQRPIYDGSKRTNERLDVLRLKYVLLLISDLQLPHEELNVLHMIYNQQTMRHEYDVLWLPIVDPTAPTSSWEPVFYDLRNYNMPWYSVDHPSMVERVAVRYIREVWKFVHMPMLVVLDPQGKPSNLDALPMMWIWGDRAFPFTKPREVALWSESEWNIELLMDDIDPRIREWITGRKVICVYGGEDIDWLRNFTLAARAAARDLQVPLEMIYVGRRNPKDKVRRCHEVIDREKLSHVFSVADYYDYVWYFWERLWSMWNSRMHIGMTIENDRTMQNIKDVLTFESSNQGWAVFSLGNHQITMGNRDKLMPVLENYRQWAIKVDHPDKFVPVLEEQLRGVHPEHHCQQLILPGQAGYIPERVVCSECGKTMDKFVMYSCCND